MHHYRPPSRERKQIRLLTVEPGQYPDPVRCSLRHVVIDEEPYPCFETISYCWGDSSKRSWLTIDGITVNVPASSKAAIQRMRLKDTTLTIWIDAICINQADLAERAMQVSFIDGIYGMSCGNLIYL